MKKQILWLVLLIVVSINFSGSANLTYAAEGDSAGVTVAVSSFYTALNAMFAGNSEPMKSVWSHADDVTYMGPAGGFQKGWPEIEKIWEMHAAMKLGGKVIPDQMEITIGQDIAFTHNYEVGENFDKDGVRQVVSIRATNIFRKENGEWKMISHHTDLLPYLENNKNQ